MIKENKITVENKLIAERRDINIYHHSSRSAHLISYDRSIKIPLKADIEEDYLHISVVSGPGSLKNKSVVNLPSWANFEFFLDGKVSISHANNRILVVIPPGLPEWQLRVKRPYEADYNEDRIVIGDELAD